MQMTAYFNLNSRGIKPSDTSSDIKKAYRKAALKHHPDKVFNFLNPVHSFSLIKLYSMSYVLCTSESIDFFLLMTILFSFLFYFSLI